MLDTELTRASQAAPVADLKRLVEVRVDVTVELGRTKMTLGEALDIGRGAVIPLDRTAGAPLALKVNGKLVARGEVLVIDDVYGLRITEIIENEMNDAANGITQIGAPQAHDHEQLAA